MVNWTGKRIERVAYCLNGFDCKIKQKCVYPAGSYIGIEKEINDENYFNIYGPNNDNQAAQFYDHLFDVRKKIPRRYEDRIIIGRDLNCPMNPMDKQGGITKPERKLLNVLKKFNRPSICMTFGGLKTQRKKFYMVTKISI